MNTELNAEYLKKKAFEYINDACDEMADANNGKYREKGKQYETCFINAEYALGKYHMCLDILSDFFFDDFIEVFEGTVARVDAVTAFINKVYSWRTL